MTSEKFHELIPEYLSGQIGEEGKAAIEAMLSTRPELRAEVEELRSIWEGLGRMPEEQPTPAMRARFYQKLNDITSGRAPAATGAYAWWKPGLAGLVRQVAVAVALFCLGMLVSRVTGIGGSSHQEMAQLQNQVQTLRRTVALSLLERQSPTSRLEGVAWSAQVDRPDPELVTTLVSTLNHDSNINVRLAALDALEKFGEEPAVRKSFVDSISQQDSPLVQIALIDALVHIHDRAAAKELRKLTNQPDVNETVRQRAQWGAERLSF